MTEKYNSRNISFSFFSNIRGVSNVPAEYPCYIETDASGAESVFSMAPHFKNLFSIQLKSSNKTTYENSYTGDKINWYSNGGSSLSSLNSIIGNLDQSCFVYMNYNNYGKDHDCNIINYVKSLNSRSKKKTLICIDSFGLIDGCATVSESMDESSVLFKMLKDICKNRLNKGYIVGSSSNPRYRVILDLEKGDDL